MRHYIAISILGFCLGCKGDLSQNNPSDDLGTDTSVIDDMKTSTDVSTEKDSANSDDTSRDVAFDVAEDAAEDMVVTPVKQHVIVGESSGSISSFDYNVDDGTMTALDADTSAGTLSWVGLHPIRNDRLYSTSGATVRSYSYDIATGDIAFLSEGTTPAGGTHVELDHTGAVAISVSYGGDSISLLPVDANGEAQNSSMTLGADGDAFCLNAHQVRIPVENNVAYVPCLGSDYIQVLSLDPANATIASIQTADVPAGAGPRHLDFHPTQPWVYVLNETASSITIFTRDVATGMLTLVDTVTNLPNGINQGSASSDIHVSPDGSHLYAVNRQPRHEIAAFEIGGDGALTLIDHYDGAGEHSRSFALNAAGDFLMMGNRNTNDFVTFSRDPATGVLTFVREDEATFPGGPMFVGFLAH